MWKRKFNWVEEESKRAGGKERERVHKRRTLLKHKLKWVKLNSAAQQKKKIITETNWEKHKIHLRREIATQSKSLLITIENKNVDEQSRCETSRHQQQSRHCNHTSLCASLLTRLVYVCMSLYLFTATSEINEYLCKAPLCAHSGSGTAASQNIHTNTSTNTTSTIKFNRKSAQEERKNGTKHTKRFWCWHFNIGRTWTWLSSIAREFTIICGFWSIFCSVNKHISCILFKLKYKSLKNDGFFLVETCWFMIWAEWRNQKHTAI